MAKYVNITANDTIITTDKITKGLFTGDLGSIAGSSLTTASLSTTQKSYYYNMQLSSADQFSVAYGHPGGSGSSDETSTTFGKTRAIYNKFASMLLPFDEVKTGFIFNGTSQSQGCYFITFERARMKDRLNRKNWTLNLSGSHITGADTAIAQVANKTLALTDNSNLSKSFATPVGAGYEIISGTLGTRKGGITYGHYFPSVGVLALSALEMSASGLRGKTGYMESGSDPIAQTIGVGLAPDLDTSANNHGKLAASILLGGTLTFRNEEDQTSATYFCRLHANEFNFSNNPTFASGSRNEFQVPSFEGRPQTFITTIGLYNSNDHLMAVGRLSSPVQKNFSSEATVKVKLTY
tara:strand:- start:1226 stop:2281 length:1056 start_codon:yes stop_codon:yes gene_type:complete